MSPAEIAAKSAGVDPDVAAKKSLPKKRKSKVPSKRSKDGKRAPAHKTDDPDFQSRAALVGGLHLPVEQQAAMMGVPLSTWRRYLQQNEDVKTAIALGQATFQIDITAALINAAKRGNVDAQKFFLERKGGWNKVETASSKAPEDTAQEIADALKEMDDTIEKPPGDGDE